MALKSRAVLYGLSKGVGFGIWLGCGYRVKVRYKVEVKSRAVL